MRRAADANILFDIELQLCKPMNSQSFEVKSSPTHFSSFRGWDIFVGGILNVRMQGMLL